MYIEYAPLIARAMTARKHAPAPQTARPKEQRAAALAEQDGAAVTLVWQHAGFFLCQSATAASSAARKVISSSPYSAQASITE